MIDVDVSGWAKVNLWHHPSGELCVRPGLRRLYTPDSGREIVGGFSVLNSYTPEVWHYIFDVATSGTLDLRLRVLDETFQVVQIFPINADMKPRVITHAVVEGMGLICSPDFPTLFFVVGSGVRFATSVASRNSATTAIAVPRGICVAWCNRVVIFNGRSMFVSDPVTATGGDVRTFVAENQNQRPGVVYGAHEGAGDALVVITSVGTYALGSDAAAVGIVGSNGTSWRQTSHVCATSYASSCAVKGRIYALTQQGYAHVDTEDENEIQLTEPLMPRALAGRISLSDFRTARMYASDDGPMVGIDGLNVVHHSDLARESSSWWKNVFVSTTLLRGTLRDLDGGELLLTNLGVWVADGDFDGEIALGDDDVEVDGVLLGTIPLQNQIVTSVDVAGALGGSSSLIGCAVRGSLKTRAMPVDGNGYTIDASAAQAGKRLTTTPVASCTFQFGAARCARGDDMGIEIEVRGCMNRVGESISIDTDKRERPGVVA